MSKSKHGIGAGDSGAIAPESSSVTPIALSDAEQWSNTDDMPTVEDVVSRMGLQYLGAVDAPDPAPLVVPLPLFVKIQAADREMAVIAARRQELMELAIDLLGVDRVIHQAVIDLDTGTVTLTSNEGTAS